MCVLVCVRVHACARVCARYMRVLVCVRAHSEGKAGIQLLFLLCEHMRQNKLLRVLRVFVCAFLVIDGSFE